MSSTISDSTTRPKKLGGYDFYREVLRSPKYIVAPMVDQSELAWRRLSRRYGAQLIYTPMINAKMWADESHKHYRINNFDIVSGEEGDPATDRPLIVQFCANDPEKLLASAKMLEGYCDAVDINLGCPQDIAKKGRYGAFLMDDWDLIYKLINTLHTNLSIPVTAKFRVFPTVEKTVEYAKMLERAGAQILTCHGRLKEQRGQASGLADWSKIRAVKEAVSVPVFANGNILFQSDIEDCLRATGADGVMSAEGQLYNAALFAGLPPIPGPSSSSSSSTPSDPSSSSPIPSSSTLPPPLNAESHPSHVDLALEYLSIVQSLKTRTSVSAVKGHLFKLMRPALSRETDLREQMGKVKIGGKDADVSLEGGALQPYVDICLEMKRRMERDAKAVEGKTLEELVTIDEPTGLRVLPHWLAQPYFRPPPPPPPKKEKEPKPRLSINLSASLPAAETTVVVPAKRTI
ncbi:Dus-domain-containing protein [Dendrothele bispora CBS 962.96]|uniref:tRNA-dihydrouridine(16/17) synthase [NAD(P)(+)] n=1 Tax=Dendrothele bispora (strain CBS 962.96) TaxID=1314807 RepID=A0A4S8MAI1_DENBC|nr:Dus-domain-containing protein [Dendrothele bispora CBS 962.96]